MLKNNSLPDLQTFHWLEENGSQYGAFDVFYVVWDQSLFPQPDEAIRAFMEEDDAGLQAIEVLEYYPVPAWLGKEAAEKIAEVSAQAALERVVEWYERHGAEVEDG